MDTPITRAEYDEHNRRMEDEHRWMNRRLELLEESVQQNGSIVLSVEKLANNMEGMLKEQERQGERLEAIVGAPASAFAVGVVLIIAEYIK